MKHIQIFRPISPNQSYILYCDGSHRPLDLVPSIGIGAELRDIEDNLILTFSEQIPISLLPPSVIATDIESFALTKVLEFCYQEGVRHVHVMSDSDGLCVKIQDFLTAKTEDIQKFSTLMNSPNQMKRSLFHSVDKIPTLSVFSISRDFNKSADFYSRSTDKILKNHTEEFAFFKGTNSTPIRLKDPKIKEHTHLLESFPNLVKNSNHPSPFDRHTSSSMMFVPFDSTNAIIGCDPNNQMSIDIQDLSTHFQIKVFKPQNNNYNYFQFKQIVLKYPKKSDRYFALLFVLFNLISNKSSINLLEEQNPHYKIKMLHHNYTHKDWNSFKSGEVQFAHTKLALTKKLFNSLETNLKNMNASHANLGEHYLAFFNCIYQQPSPYYFHKTFNQAALYWSAEEIAEFNRRGAEQHMKKISP